MKKGACAAAALLALVPASGHAASAAATIRLDVFPSKPRVGQLATIQLRTFWTLEGGERPPAVFPKTYPWSVAAVSPSWKRLSIRMRREPSDPYLWSGTARFPSKGRWALCVYNFPCRSPARVQVTVRAKRAPTDVWDRLERPLRVPSIARGSACPTAPADPEVDLTRFGFGGTAWGPGPAYPGGLDRGDGKPILRYEDPIPPTSGFYRSAWFGNKVLWMVDPRYSGPLLIRGRQLDGPSELRFETGRVPPRMLPIQPRPGPRGRPSYTRVRGPGCYAYQVDGLRFSYLIVFEAAAF